MFLKLHGEEGGCTFRNRGRRRSQKAQLNRINWLYLNFGCDYFMFQISRQYFRLLSYFIPFIYQNEQAKAISQYRRVSHWSRWVMANKHIEVYAKLPGAKSSLTRWHLFNKHFIKPSLLTLVLLESRDSWKVLALYMLTHGIVFLIGLHQRGPKVVW